MHESISEWWKKICRPTASLWYFARVESPLCYVMKTWIIVSLKLCQNKKSQNLLGCSFFQSFFFKFESAACCKKKIQKTSIPANVRLFLFCQDFRLSKLFKGGNYLRKDTTYSWNSEALPSKLGDSFHEIDSCESWDNNHKCYI